MDTILITGGSGFVGTNLIDYFLSKNISNLVNVDVKEPVNINHKDFWIQCDIKDAKKLETIFDKYNPRFVIHLAARADVDGVSLDDYEDNTTGTEVLVKLINQFEVERSVITSTQFVYQDKEQPLPDHDQHYKPHTIYGESKVITEKYTRRINGIWTIIRPTNIWGKWHWRYPYEFWKVLYERKYIHPKSDVIRSYGYAGTIAEQIFKIQTADEEIINNKVIYVGDRPICLESWVDAFAIELTGKPSLKFPKFFIYLIAIFGSMLKSVNVKFPITISRYKSMTTSNPAPMEKTFEVLGESELNLELSVKETVEWLYKHHKDIYKNRLT